jgi:hypothetical protein
MTNIGAPGLTADDDFLGPDFRLEEAIDSPTDRRVFAVYKALSRAGP